MNTNGITNEYRDERFQNKYVQLFISLPIFIYELENINGLMIKGKLKRIEWISTISVGKIPIGLLINIPFIIYIFTK